MSERRRVEIFAAALWALLASGCAGPDWTDAGEPDPLDRAFTRSRTDLIGGVRGRGDAGEASRERFAALDRRRLDLEQRLASIEGDDAAVADLLERSREARSSGDSWDRYQYARVLEAADRLEEAEAVLEELVRDEPGFAIAQRRVGELALLRRRPGRAVAAFRAEVDARPELGGAHYRLGWAFAEAGDREGAEAALRHSLELDPKLEEARMQLSQELLARYDFYGAEQVVQEGLLRKPDSRSLQLYLGQFYLQHGFLESSIEQVEDRKDDPIALSLTAQAHELLGRREEALEAYRAAVDHPEARSWLRDLPALRAHIEELAAETNPLRPRMLPGVLIRRLETSQDPLERRQMAQELAKFVPLRDQGGAAAYAYLQRALQEDADDRIRRIALQALQSITSGPQSVPRLAEVLRTDESSWVRVGACNLLVGLRTGRAIPVLIEALADEDEAVFEAARSGLYSLTGQRMSTRLSSLLGPDGRAELLEEWRRWWQQQQGSRSARETQAEEAR